MSNQTQFLPLLIVVLVLSSFILLGLVGKAREGMAYGFSRRYIGRIGGGAAIASNWMSTAQFSRPRRGPLSAGVSRPGLCHRLDRRLCASPGAAGGAAPPLRQAYRSDFVGARYESPAARLISAVISIVISAIYCVAQFKGIGLIFAWLFSFDYTTGVMVGALAVVSYVAFSGMLGVTRNQQLQYTVLIISFILPLMVLARKMGYFWILPSSATVWRWMSLPVNRESIWRPPMHRHPFSSGFLSVSPDGRDRRTPPCPLPFLRGAEYP